MTTITTTRMRLGTWTILAEGSESVHATVSQEREAYTVRDADGRVLGRYPTAQLALASIAGEAPSQASSRMRPTKTSSRSASFDARLATT